MRKESIQRITRLVLFLLLLAPILIYIYNFGTAISNSHTRWSEMGAAMSGIYSPIFSFLALLVLFAQTNSQNQINEHQYDQTFIREARGDIQYYLEQLDRSLDMEVQPNVSVRDVLNASFILATPQALMCENLKKTANDLNRTHPRTYAIWSAIYPILVGLRAINRYPYEHNFTSARQKIITMASYGSCVALDNYHWVLTEGQYSLNYEFSTIIPGNKQGA